MMLSTNYLVFFILGLFLLFSAGFYHHDDNELAEHGAKTTSGIVVSKKIKKKRKGRSEHKYYKTVYEIGIVYPIDITQITDPKVLDKLEKKHFLKNTVGNTKLEDIVVYFPNPNTVKPDNLLYIQLNESKDGYSKLNINDEYKFEYRSNKPWLYAYDLKSGRGTTKIVFLLSSILFLLSAIGYYQASKD